MNIVAMEQARKRLLEAEDALERADLGELAFEIGLKADLVAEYLAEELDDGDILGL
jgi:hypothetical protein